MELCDVLGISRSKVRETASILIFGVNGVLIEWHRK